MHKRQNSKRMTAAARSKTKRLGQPLPEKTASEVKERFVPQTDLGRRLWKIRQRIVASGQPLLSREEIESDLRERRGEPGAEVSS